VLEYGGLHLSLYWPVLSPEVFGLHGFERLLSRGIAIASSFAAQVTFKTLECSLLKVLRVPGIHYVISWVSVFRVALPPRVKVVV
jgi:hypothetical protein